MKKIISFCLWGDNPKYTIGAIENAKLAKTIYPDWTCRFYAGTSTPDEIWDELYDMDNTEMIKKLKKMKTNIQNNFKTK